MKNLFIIVISLWTINAVAQDKYVSAQEEVIKLLKFYSETDCLIDDEKIKLETLGIQFSPIKAILSYQLKQGNIWTVNA